MKHLLCEHHNMISELKADGLVSTQVVQKEQEQLETELHKDMRAIVVNTEKLDIEDLIKEHELVCSILILHLKICVFNVLLCYDNFQQVNVNATNISLVVISTET